MNWYFGQSLWMLLAAFALGCLVAWLWARLHWRKVTTDTGGSAWSDGALQSGTASASGFESGGFAPSQRVESRGSETATAHEQLQSRYESLVGDRDRQAKAFSSLEFERSGLRTAVSERDTQIQSLTAEVDRLKLSAKNREGATVQPVAVQGLAGGLDANKAELAKLRGELGNIRSELVERSSELKTARDEAALLQKRVATAETDFGASNESHEKALTEIRVQRDRTISGLRAEHENALADHRRRSEAAESELTTSRASLSSMQGDLSKLAAEHSAGVERLRLAQAEHAITRTELSSHVNSTDSTKSILAAKDEQLANSAAVLAKAQAESAEFVVRSKKSDEELASLRAELTASKSAAAELKANHDTSLKALADTSTERNSLVRDRDEAIARMHNELNGVRNELDGVRGESQGFVGERDGLRSELLGVRGELNNVQTELNNVQTERERAREESQSFAGERDGLRSALAAVRSDLDGVRSQHDGVRSELERVGHELEGVRHESLGFVGERDGARGELDRVRNELGGVRGEAEGIARERDELRLERDGARGELDRIRGELDGVRGELDQVRNELGGSQEAAQRSHDERDQFSRDLDGVRSERDGAHAERDQLRQERDSLSEELDGVRKEVLSTRGHYQSAAAELEAARAEAENIGRDRDGARGDLDAIRAEFARTKNIHSSEISALRSEHGRVLNLRDDTDQSLKDQLEAAKAEVSEANASRESMGQQFDSLKSELAAAKASLELTTQEHETLREQLGDAYGELDVTKSQHEEQVVALQSDFDRNWQDRERALVQEHTVSVGDYERRRLANEAELNALRGSFDQVKTEHAQSLLALEKSRSDNTQSQSDLAKTRERIVDDLEQIEGVGPAFSRALQGSGLRTFEAVRDADEQTLRAAIERAGLKFAPSLPTWNRQAGYLASGDSAGFAAYTEYLVAGQDPVSLAGSEAVASDAESTKFGQTEPENLRDASSFVATDGQVVPQGLDASVAVAGDASKARDNLQRVEGIGPRIDQALQNSGINTFRDLSRASEQRLRAALEAAGLSFAPSLTTWAEQATLLARGDEDGFVALTSRLIAGRRESK